ncbi:MAG: hypothetical protein CM1200mP10_27240 [Candidatus Neomarinimicrobiota bacterium]|nr:MAG: hypothetical protein CM1200mP10_27240 [Candidatus Neomarinimicrobiota bacterium]
MRQRKNAHILNAVVPPSSMFGYVTDLRSLTQGRAVFYMGFSNYQKVPANIETEIIERMHGKAS